MSRLHGPILAAAALCVMLTPGSAGFVENGACVFTGTYDQVEPQIAPDGSGGAFIVWQDDADGYRIVAQRIDDHGRLLWPGTGVVVCDEAMEQYDPRICSDGSGGAIIAWGDNRNGVYQDEWDIYGQRLDPDGVAQWDEGGIPICTSFGSQWLADLTADGSGGAIIAWEDWSSGTYSDIHLQRVDGGGAKIWGDDGVLVSDVAGSQELPSIAADGTGGAVVAYQEESVGWNIYAQRVGSAGQFLWQAGGVPICTAAEGQYAPRITGDGSGGAVIVWIDYRRGDLRSDLYAQRVQSVGTVQWAANGVAVCTAVENQEEAVLVPDGAGGAIIAWGDYRNNATSGKDIYAQRLDGAGVRQWPAAGVPICTATNHQWYPQIVPDGAGGAVVAWGDWRTGVAGNYDIYAQRVGAAGAVAWNPNGIPVCNAEGEQGDAAVIADGGGGAIVAWEDARWLDYDVYALRISGDGTPVATLLVQYSARYESGAVHLEWILSEPGDDRSFTVERAPAGDPDYEELTGEVSVRDDRVFSYTDDGCAPGADYTYRIFLVEGSERSMLFESGPVGVPPLSIALYQNHPNPFNPSTTIPYYLPEPCRVRLSLYDVLGRRVRVLVDRGEAAGKHAVHWDGLDSHGNILPAGIYLYRLEAGKARLSKKMIMVR